MYQKRLEPTVDAGGRSQRQKTSLKICSQRNSLARDRDTLVVSFGHIIHFEASKLQTLTVNFPKKVQKGRFSQ